MDRDDFSRYALVFLAGAITGAAVALLYAPMKGRETRRKLQRFSEKARDVMEDGFDDVQKTVRKFTK